LGICWGFTFLDLARRRGLSWGFEKLPQSSVIVGALVVGWLIFIVLRNELPAYIAVLLGSHPSTVAAKPGTAVNTGSTTGMTIGGVLGGGGGPVYGGGGPGPTDPIWGPGTGTIWGIDDPIWGGDGVGVGGDLPL
jgi:hypothetical protein